MATQSQLAATRPISLAGCRSISVTSLEIADYEGPVEYWDAETELVWELFETSLYHEAPRVRLIAMVNDIGKMRGMPISACGTTDLQERDANNQRTRIAQADESIYLDAGQVPVGPVIIVGKSPLPDVVLEVDLTTDIRDRKLELYAGWGVPELWVEVPDARLPSKRKRPGLTIYTLKGEQYHQVAESTAFPTWRANEIHAGLNEPYSSSITVGVVRRVGRIMGDQNGTGPENDPFLQEERRLSRLEGRDEGRRQGHEQGRVAMLKELLAARNVTVSTQLDRFADMIAGLPGQSLTQAALQCGTEADFLDRVELLRSQTGNELP